MALNFLLKRSGTADKRPDPAAMALGELDLNYDDITGGIFYKNASGSVVKVGPAQVGADAPNATPAGEAGNSVGEFWYDTSEKRLKIFNGTSWVVTTETLNGLTDEAAPFNTALGTGSLTGSGSCSTAIGFGAQGSGSATGKGNTSVGYITLDALTSGQWNSALGYAAGTSVTTGYRNTLLGYRAGAQITTGVENTIIGAYEGNQTISCSVVIANGNGDVKFQANGPGAWSPDGVNYGNSGQVLQSRGSGATPNWVDVANGTVADVNATSPVTIDKTDPSNFIVGIDSASTTGAGAVQLNDNIDSTSTTEAATANAVKTAYDAAVAAQGSADSAIPCASITAKGDLLAGTTASTPTALPVGTDGQFLVADSGSATGLVWADNPTAPTETGTVSSINPILPSSGTALCGGYYAGSIDDAGTCVALIIAPKDVGQVRCSNGIQQNWLPTTISRSTTNGALITECFRCSVLTSGSFAFEYAYNLNACGYNDWYIPARCEMLTVVQQLGRNFTTVPAFQAGGSQVMDCNSYSTATEASTASVWTQSSVSCSLSTGQQLKNNSSDLRLIRREPLSNLATCTALSFSSAQGFDTLTVGDQIVQEGTGAVVSICALNAGTCSMTVAPVSGTLSTGCAFPLTGGYVPAPIDAGTDGQVLKVCTACDSGTVWANATTGTVTSVTAGTGLTGGTITGSGTIALDTACVVAPSILTTKGDIIAASAASTPTALPVGADGQFLVADSSCTTGLAWTADIAPSAITDCTGATGTAGQVLSSTGTALEWVDAGGGGGGGDPATPIALGTVYGSTTVLGKCVVALGYGAAYETVTNGTLPGDYLMTAIGYNAAAAVPPSAKGGTYIGYSAGRNVTYTASADGFIFIGREAGRYAAEGDLMIGSRAGYCYAGGGGEILIGTSAGCSITGTATCNIGIGAATIQGLTCGSSNIAIGNAAMSDKTRDCYTIAIGSCALCSNTNNTGTVAIGHEVAYRAPSSSSVFIGYRAGYCQVTNYGNVIVIGANAEASASRQTTIGTSFMNSYRIYGTWSNASDARDKTDVTALPLGIDFIKTLNPVKYTWQHREPAEGKDGCQEVGFLAQEFQAAEQAVGAQDYLHLVEDDDPDHLFINQNRLIPVLVKAIQELSDKNDALEARIAALEGN